MGFKRMSISFLTDIKKKRNCTVPTPFSTLLFRYIENAQIIITNDKIMNYNSIVTECNIWNQGVQEPKPMTKGVRSVLNLKSKRQKVSVSLCV